MFNQDLASVSAPVAEKLCPMVNVSQILSFVLIFFVAEFAHSQEEYVGLWQVQAIKSSAEFEPDLYEIKYPTLLQIEETPSGLSGEYEDQHQHRTKLAFAKTVNDGADLIFASEGTTKFKAALMPIHQAKIENGKLKGTTYCAGRKCFDLVGIKKEDITKRRNAD